MWGNQREMLPFKGAWYNFLVHVQGVFSQVQHSVVILGKTKMTYSI